MTAEWYYGRNGTHSGPVTAVKLRELAAGGDLLPTDLVWTEGLEQWISAESVEGLFTSRARMQTSSVFTSPGVSAATVLVECPHCRAKYRAESTVVTSERVTCKVCRADVPFTKSEDEDGPILDVGFGIARPRPLSEAEIKGIRRRMSRIARGIPHHGIQDFGTSIDVLGAGLVPWHLIVLESLYDARRVSREESPHGGEDVPPATVDETTVSPWSQPFSQRTTFESHEERVHVDGSHVVTNCGDCLASGEITCPSCTGHGHVVCPACRGRKAVACPQCRGEGAIDQSRSVQVQKRCFICSGTGQPTRVARSLGRPGSSDRCGHCFGRGFRMENETEYFKVPCPRCGTRGGVPCETCGVSGAVQCHQCLGGTRVTCPRCRGLKKVCSFLVVTRTLRPTVLEAWCTAGVDFPETPADVRETIAARKRPTPLVVVNEPAIGDDLDRERRLSAEPVLVHESNRLLTEARKDVSESQRLIHQRIETHQQITAFIRYRFDTRDYVAWFIGPEAECHLGGNPFVDMAKAAVTAGIDAWSRGDTEEAVHQVLRSRAIAAAVGQGTTTQTLEEDVPLTLKTLVSARAAITSVQAGVVRGFTDITEAFDAVRKKGVGKWLRDAFRSDEPR